MSNQLSYAAGSTFPPQNGPLRLYSMRFCPYSQRVRLVLAAKNVPCEIVNINAKRRPEWYLEKNPLGLVPTLQHDDGKQVNESFIISEYLDGIYPQNKLIPTEPYVKARNQMLIDNFQRIAALLFRSLKFKDAEAFNEISKILDNYEKALGSEDFFGGKNPGITDYMIWPWFERFETLKPLTNNELDKKRFPKLTAWVQRMQKQDAVKQCASEPSQILEFYKVSLTNQEPDYDIGLEKPEPPPPAEGEAEAKPAE